ncbi:MAG: decarboxylating NADP(+)-dependent phosphogluconate dehydrogenase [Kiritimatiellia bacterium]
MQKYADIGVIGLAVMGENLILNMESKGFTVACFNRTAARVEEFTAGRAKDKNIIGCRTLAELVASLQRPRKIMMMVRAGAAVDDLIESLLPLLEPGDIIIDGGNSHYPDTIRRVKYVERKGLLYIGTGISGGEEGALTGPSIMPGGSPAAWPAVKPIFQKIAARTADGEICCDWVGEGGAGHFVKMVHNGIEYGDMQLIAEAYHMMKSGLRLSNEEMHIIFANWSSGPLDSYLIEITSDILAYQEDGDFLLDKILDAAGQKGTGKWTAAAALDLGQPLTLIAEAVYARGLSALKEERTAASRVYDFPPAMVTGHTSESVQQLESALYASKIVSYAQGYQLMRAMAQDQKWNLNYGGIALMWRGGCIIRSAFLGKIKEAFDRNPELTNLLLDPFFKDAIIKALPGWRRVVAGGAMTGIPLPAMGSALSWFDGYHSENLPANLIQAQRDYFGAHTYERTDRPRGEFFHTNWTGRGGTTAAGTYGA